MHWVGANKLKSLYYLRSDAARSAENVNIKIPLVYMTPSGKPLKQKDIVNFSKQKGIIILCGRFEGVDTRVIDNLGFEQISIGDYVLSGGEVAAFVVLDSILRSHSGRKYWTYESCR